MRVIISLISIAACAVAIPYFGLQAQSQLETVQAVTRFTSLETYRLEENDVNSSVEALGVIEAAQTTALTFNTSGQVVAVYVQDGQYVHEGEILAVLSYDAAVIAYQQAALELNRAELDLYDLQTVEADELALAEANVVSAWSSYNYNIGRITSDDLAAADLAYQNALLEAENKAQQASQAPGGYESMNYQTLTASAGEASFNAEIARLQSERLRAEQTAIRNSSWGGVITAEAELDLLLAGPTESELQLAQLDVEKAQIALDRAIQNYTDSFLVAPHEGYVDSMGIEVGIIVSDSDVVMDIVDLSSYQLTIEIDEVDLDFVDVGMPIEVRLDAMPGLVLTAELGQIAMVSTNNDGIVVYEADVILNEISPIMRVGMTVEADIITESRTNVLRVPNKFLREDDDITFVSILQPDGTLKDVPIQLGLRGAIYSEVTSGISSGTQIAITTSSTQSIPGPGFLGGDQ